MKKVLAFALCALLTLFSAGTVHAHTVAQASRLPDKAPFTMRGNIVLQTGSDRYLFRDSSGEITIKIKDNRWGGLRVGPDDRIEISGELKRDKKNSQTFYADVKVISRAASETNRNVSHSSVNSPPPSGNTALFAYPVNGRVTSPYGWRSSPINGRRVFHEGIDLSSPAGTAVRAAAAGRVSTAGNCRVYGRHIIITHDNGYQTKYAHLRSMSVVQGARVEQGMKIGEVGNTGLTTGPHLHFAVFRNDQTLNPLNFLGR